MNEMEIASLKIDCLRLADGSVSEAEKKFAFVSGSKPNANAPIQAKTFSRSMDFGAALNALKAGRRAARTGWNGKGLWLELQTADVKSKMTLPYVFINCPGIDQNTPGARVPWLASQTDMLADDWILVE